MPSDPTRVPAHAVSGWSLADVEIDERAEPPRTRPFSDVLRLILSTGLIALIVFAGSIGSETTAGLQEDITTAVTSVPSLVVSVLTTLNSLIVLALPLYLVVELAVRRRWRLLVTAVIAGLLAVFAAELFRIYAPELLEGALLDSLTLPAGAGGTRTSASFALFAGVTALITVEGRGARPRTVAMVWTALLALAVLTLIDRRATPLALVISVLAGQAIGLAVRYVAGTENPRAPARVVAAALARIGILPERMRQLDEESELGRRFEIVTTDGVHALAQVLDPDRRTTRVLSQLTRVVRVRTWVTRAPGISGRSQMQQAAVPVLMARDAGVRTPRMLGAVLVDDDTTAYVEERIPALRALSSFSALAISNAALDQIWGQIELLHDSAIAHEGLNPDSFGVDDDGRVWVLGLAQGEIAAPYLRMRLDRAELLIATAVLVGIDRAVDAAERAIGTEDLANLATVMQPIALNAATRRSLGEHEGLLETLRDAATARYPGPTVDDVKLERLRPRSVISLVAATFAVYVLAGQLGDVNFATVLRSIDWMWAAVAVVASLATYVGSLLTISPFSPVRISFARWMGAQFAATFVTLVAPAAVGSAGTNVRVIQKAGAPPGLALASVGVSTLVSLVTTVIAFVGLSIWSTDEPIWDVEVPSTGVLYVVAGVVVAIVVAFIVPLSRRVIVARLRPTWDNTVPSLMDAIRDPRRLLTGVFGSLLTSFAYAVTLYASVRAYGADVPFAVAAVVYLGAGLLGSVAPTPGGIGAVEAALIAGLSAVGVPPEAALPAALLYRTVTFWLPTLPGWFAFQWMQRHDAI